MKFKAEEFLFLWILAIVFGAFTKMLFAEVTIASCVMTFVVLAAIQSINVINHLFPKRPDLYSEIESLKQEMNDLKAKNDRLESVTTGLQMGRR